MTSAPRISVVVPTLGRLSLLARVLSRLDAQSATRGSFELIVAADAKHDDLGALDRLCEHRRYPVRRVSAAIPGASAARNAGWQAAAAELILFIDDDILPLPSLIAGHLSWHARHPAPEIGVLGRVRWADELQVTPFMRWLEHGIQFDYGSIAGEEAHWGHFYTANASVKRALLEHTGGFDEHRLPYGYEDLDLALRMHQADDFRLLYNAAAVAEHVHPMDLEFWKRRVARIAISEREFVRLHPEVAPYFHDMFTAAAAAPAAGPRAVALTRFVPRRVPFAGPRVWGAAGAYYRQALAPHFLAAWEAAGSAPPPAPGGSGSAPPAVPA